MCVYTFLGTCMPHACTMYMYMSLVTFSRLVVNLL